MNNKDYLLEKIRETIRLSLETKEFMKLINELANLKVREKLDELNKEFNDINVKENEQ